MQIATQLVPRIFGHYFFVGPGGDFADVAQAVAHIQATPPRCGMIQLLPGANLTLTSTLKIFNPITLRGTNESATSFVFNHTGVGIRVSNGDLWQASRAYGLNDYVVGTGADASNVRYRCTQAGTSGSSEPAWNATPGQTTNDGTVRWVCELELNNWCLENFGFRMHDSATGNGIVIQHSPNQGILQNIFWSGGNANVWGVEVDQTNVVDMRRVRCSANSNGILWRNSNPTKFPYNFGDSVMSKLDLSLNAVGTVGVKLQGPSTSTRTINNLKVDQFSIAGTGGVNDFQVGIWIENAARLTFDHGDIEATHWGVLEIAQLGSGYANQDNGLMRINFIPAAAQTEAKGYCRGAMLQADHATGTATFVVRSDWVSQLGLANGDAIKVVQDDFGIWSRTISTIAANVPAAGLSTITTTTNLNANLTVARNACLTKAAAFPLRTRIDGVGASTGTAHFMKGMTQAPGYVFRFEDQATMQGVLFQWLSAGILGLRGERSPAYGSGVGAICFDVADGATANPDIFPEKAGEVLSLGRSGKQTVRFVEIAAKSGAYTAALTDEVILVSAAPGWTLTLPAAGTAEGKLYTVIKTDNNSSVITIQANGSETINGSNTYSGLNAQYKRVTIVCDGAAWYIREAN